MRSAQAGTAPLTGQPRPGGRRRARGAVSRLPTRRAGAAPAGKTQVTSVFSALAPGLLQAGMRSARHREAGFTLIELLVVVAIIGSLAAIAIPQFTSQKGKGYDARVMQDARNAATAQEAYLSDTLTYFTGSACRGGGGAGGGGGVVVPPRGGGGGKWGGEDSQEGGRARECARRAGERRGARPDRLLDRRGLVLVHHHPAR